MFMQAELQQAPSSIVLRARALVGEDQRTFAKRVGSAQPLICKYETGQVSPPASVLIHCMNLLGGFPATISTEELAALVKTRLDGSHMQNARLAVARLIECLPASSVPAPEVPPTTTQSASQATSSTKRSTQRGATRSGHNSMR